MDAEYARAAAGRGTGGMGHVSAPHAYERERGVTSCDPVPRPGAQTALTAIECDLVDEGWSPVGVVTSPAVVFLRAGAVARRCRGQTTVFDASLAYFERPGDEYTLRHIGQAGHLTTVLAMAPDVAAEVLPSLSRLPASGFPTSPGVDLHHRQLLQATARADDPFCIDDLVALLTSCVTDALMVRRGCGRRSGTATSRRRAVNIAREMLASAPAKTNLAQLATAASLSPHHLSRVFREETGTTLGRHRNRVRIRLALNRLEDGAADLSAVAHELGFADHAHFTRTMRAELGQPPREVRASLQRPLSSRHLVGDELRCPLGGKHPLREVQALRVAS